MNRVDKAIRVLLKEIRLEYPPHHWKHIKVLSAFWNLVEALGGKINEEDKLE